MSYTDLGMWLFLGWWGGCWLAYALSRLSRANRDTRLLPFVFGLTIATFYVCMHGRAGHWHYWWYALNAIPNMVLLMTAWYAPEARARWPLVIFSSAGILLDITYFDAAATKNYLPGHGYFAGAATVETLQVLCMIYFSGPIEPVMKRVWTFISTRKWPWTHQQLQKA